MFVQQDVSAGLQLVLMVSLGAGSSLLVAVVSYVVFCGIPEPLYLQGTSTNFLVLKIKTHKTIRISHALPHKVYGVQPALGKTA